MGVLLDEIQADNPLRKMSRGRVVSGGEHEKAAMKILKALEDTNIHGLRHGFPATLRLSLTSEFGGCDIELETMLRDDIWDVLNILVKVLLARSQDLYKSGEEMMEKAKELDIKNEAFWKRVEESKGIK
jgi:hypothetical protein